MTSTSSSSQLTSAVKTRERYFQRVQLCFDLISKPSQENDFLQRCKFMDSTFDKFEAINDLIVKLNMQLDAKESHVDTLNVTKSFEELFFKVKAHEAKLIESQAVSKSSKQSTSCEAQVKLPTISVPVFDGNITEFSSWKSLFDELVHFPTYLSNIQKFSYLKSYLRGSALLTIESIAFTAANYPLAYKTLTDRYAKTRTLASHFMNKLLDFQPITKDSPANLRLFLDQFHITVESLKSLCLIDLEEFILLHLGLRVLDPRSSLEFEKDHKDTSFPTFQQLVDFVKNKLSVLEINAESSHVSLSKAKQIHPKMLVANVEPSKRHTSPEKKPPMKCFVCHKDFHKISVCSKFKSLEPSQRFGIIKNLKLCFGCFSPSHSSEKCVSQYSCRACGSTAHHSLLHPSPSKPDFFAENQPPRVTTALDQRASVSKMALDNVTQTSLQSHIPRKCNSVASNTNVLLGTATVQIQDNHGNWITVRCVIDPGSQISAITERLAQMVKLPRRHCATQICGIGGTVKAKGEIICNILPHFQISRLALSEPLQMKTVVLSTIASNLSSSVPGNVVKQFAHLQLADTSYTNQKTQIPIEMLIGAEYFANIMISEHPIIQGSPAAVPTKLGWLLMGRVTDDIQGDQQTKCTSLFISNQEDPISVELRRFWEIEEVSEHPQIENPEDQECEKHFIATHNRDATGKYIVSLPFKGNVVPDLGSNEDVALRRFKVLTNKLEKNPEIKNLYHENLQSYVDAGHMVVSEDPSSYFLVHHGVYKTTPSKTKVRVVFDPNLKSSNNMSLAESLMVGPKLQRDIGDLLIAFQLNAVAVTSDIEGMYRSIWIAEADRKYQQIIWHGQSDEPVKYALTTVTFGLPPSPYQAQRVLHQLVSDEGQKYPLAVPVLKNDVYVDDIVTGAKDVAGAIALRNQLVSLLEAGGFRLRKWASSHRDVIADIPQEDCEVSHSLGSDESVKLLGIKWCPGDDVFSFTVGHSDHSNVLTKRKVLSIVASIYDLNGYLAPITVWMKIFLQHLWLDKNVSWDSPLSKDLQIRWNTFSAELSNLSDIKLPRYILTENMETVDLVGFSDASGVAYAAVMYIRVCDSKNDVTTHLLRAKTKVAPLKVQTINRLELCAALLLAKLSKSLNFLHKRLKINNVYLFSDSYTVLSWLKTPPYRLKTYVANRVSQVLEISDPSQWRHVTTDKNSADLASRGTTPSQLVKNNRWFKGPSFLRSPPESWPKSIDNVEPCKSEMKTVVLMTEVHENYLLTRMERISSLQKLTRIFAYVRRFIHNVRTPQNKYVGHFSLQELKQALWTCVKISQEFYLSSDLNAVKSGKKCSFQLQTLSPILTSTGVLAVGGRLTHAPLPESAKHPIVIPKKSHLAHLLVWDCHRRTLHGGPKVVQSLLQQQWWILGGRNLIRKLLSKCVQCFKMKPTFRQPVMADIPISRYAQGRPFLNVGVDFAGPFGYKTGPRKNSPIDKCYFAIFICMSTKCVHLELVSSLSTSAFLACLDRFVGRRGLPSCIFSDHGTNFQGAASSLLDVQNLLKNHTDDITQHLQAQGVRWTFIPPHAPNFGGLWEAAVRSAKRHLRHVLHGQNWNFEELSTFLVRIEAILNSRPICGINSNPNDGVDYLSPGHFLIGAPLLSRPELDVSECQLSHLQRWHLISHVIQCFWKRWSKDFLNTLIQRSKWTKPCENINVNDIVIINVPNIPTQKWPLGVVIKVMPGSDGVTRVVEVKTAKGTLIRPVSKVAALPLQSE